eukprot:gene1157-1323_t
MRYDAFRQETWWRKNVAELFRENRDVKDQNQVKVLQDKVKSYRFFLKASKDLQTLLDDYNIGIPARDRIKKASRRVGLEVPEWPEEQQKRILDRDSIKSEPSSS